MRQNEWKGKSKISRVDVTDDNLTGRGGLALFVRYLSSVNIYDLMVGSFASLRRSQKGQPLWNIFKQIFCFFYDGTSRHLTYFDQLKEDEGYAAVIENGPEEMVCFYSPGEAFFKGVFMALWGYLSEDIEAVIRLAFEDREARGD